ncbi:MAG: diacylglycerol kinase family protein [Bacteroidetes bacterium]|nr:diacylglycerol kinase family protein [Bacteroidota bacterium]
MKQASSFSLKERGRSFGFAFAGIIQFFRSEHNAWLHLVATVIVFSAAYFFSITGMQLAALAIVTGFVWVTEIINTAIEKAMDFISTERHPAIKYIKDLSAAAVLLAAISALVTGAIIFIPKITGSLL